MKIQGYGIQGLNPYTAGQKHKQPQQIGASFADKLEISSAAQELQVASEYTNTRAEKVQQLKADIESGNYKVDAKRVAEDMLKYYKF